MTRDEAERAVLAELVYVSERELHWLSLSDAKLFRSGAASQWMRPLDADPDLAEAIDAFCARFARLQDTLGDKLLPRALALKQERVGAFLDNLHAGERAGFIGSVDDFRIARRLRNRLVHDYSSQPALLAQLLDEAHGLVPFLAHTQNQLADVLRRPS